MRNHLGVIHGGKNRRDQNGTRDRRYEPTNLQKRCQQQN
jgi:hypothetical protein